MKKLTALLIAMLLVIGSLPVTALAASNIKTDPSITPIFIVSSTVIGSGGIQLTVNKNLIEQYNPSEDPAKFSIAMSNLKVNNQPIDPSLIGSYFKSIATPMTDHYDTVSGMLMLANNVQTISDQPFSIDLKVIYTGPPASPTQVLSSNTFTLTGTIAALGTIDGFKSTSYTLKQSDLALSGASWQNNKVTASTSSPFSMNINLKSTTFFDTLGGEPTVSQVLAAVNPTVGVSDGYTAILGADGVLTVSSPNPPSAIDKNVTVTLTRQGNPSSTMTLNIPVQVTAPTPPPVTSTTQATIKSGADLSLVPPTLSTLANGVTVMDKSTTVTLRIHVSNFTHNGTQDSHLIDYLNANRSSWIKASNAVSYSNTPFRMNGTSVELVLTVPAGTYNNFKVWLSDGSNNSGNAMSYSRFVVYDTNPVYLSLKTGSIAAPSKTSMTVGDTLLYEIKASNTIWSHGSPGADFSSTLSANVVLAAYPNLWDTAFVYEGGKTYFKLTARATGTVPSGTAITLVDKNPAPTPQTLTINLPALTIKGSVTTSSNKITGIDSAASLAKNYKVNDKATSDYLNDLAVYPGDVITLEYDSDFFTWENGKPNPAAGLSSSLLSSGKIEMRSTSSGSPFDHISLVHKNGKSYVEIKIKDNLNSIKDVKFSTTVYFMVNGRRHTASQAEIKGVVTQNSYDVYSGDSVDMTAYPIIEAAETARDVELYIGNYMTLHASLTKGRSYYASSNDDFDKKDEEIFLKYTDVEQVLHIDQTGFSEGTTKVSFDYGERLYVYDGSGNYLGTTNDKVPLKTTYYLSSKRISMGVSTPVVSEVPGSATPGGSSPGGSSSGSGSSTGTSGNTGIGSNYNPNTGL